MKGSFDIAQLKRRLQEPLPGLEAQIRMASRYRNIPVNVPDNARASAVLSLFFHKEDILHLLLIKRVADGKAHSGQISFPGGKRDPEDVDLTATALREAHEEVGIIASEVQIIGQLTPLYIPVSNFQVHPFVGYTEQEPNYIISEREVDAVIEVPISNLLDDGNKTMVDITTPVVPGVIRNVNAYQLNDGNIIWGATAMMISELEVILGNML